MTMLQKIGWGFVFALLSMAAASVVEIYRKKMVSGSSTSAAIDTSISRLVPRFVDMNDESDHISSPSITAICDRRLKSTPIHTMWIII